MHFMCAPLLCNCRPIRDLSTSSLGRISLFRAAISKGERFFCRPISGGRGRRHRGINFNRFILQDCNFSLPFLGNLFEKQLVLGTRGERLKLKSSVLVQEFLLFLPECDEY